MTGGRWVRSIDALDLMLKSGWAEAEAKNTLADYIANRALNWNAEWGRYWNPLTQKLEQITSNYNSALLADPIHILFGAVRNAADEKVNLYIRGDSHGLSPEDIPGMKIRPYAIKAYTAEWQTGVFRVLGVDRDEIFFAVHGLMVSRNDLTKLLTADVILRFQQVLDYDFGAAGRTWGALEDNCSVDTDPVTKTALKVIPRPALGRWWVGMSEMREPMSIRTLWAKAQLDFPSHTVPRRYIEELSAGRKRGRKPNSP